MKISIATVVYNEEDNLIEWVSHYIAQGFDKIYVLDDSSTDNTVFILERLERIGVLTLIKGNYQKTQPNRQIDAFNRIAEMAREDGFDAIGFIDTDEYLMSEDPRLPAKLELTKLFTNHSISAIAINWLNFGSSGNLFKLEGLVLERFTNCSRHLSDRNCLYKSFIRLDRFISMANPHYAVISAGRYISPDGSDVDRSLVELRGKKLVPCHSVLVIQHYPIKSAEEFIKTKLNKGGFGPTIKGNRISYFHGYDENHVKNMRGRFFIEKNESIIDGLCNKDKSLNKFTPLRDLNTFSRHNFIHCIDTPITYLNNAVGSKQGIVLVGWAVSYRFTKISLLICEDGRNREIKYFDSRPDVAEHCFGEYAKWLDHDRFGFSSKIIYNKTLSITFKCNEQSYLAYEYPEK